VTGTFAIAGRPIGPEHPPFVIAELSGNHNGEVARALALMDAAQAAGADAVKLQTYTPDTMTIDHDGPDFVVRGGLWDGRRLYDLYGEAQTPWNWHPRLFARGRELGVPVFSTPFDETAVDFLEGLGAPAYKVASFELVDLPLIRRVAATGKPTIMSTGMGSPAEIAEAVAAFRGAGGGPLVLLHCISAYPSDASEANLRRIGALAAETGCYVGLSDHTAGHDVAVAAVALGARVVEKHMTLRRADGGPDAAFSLEPDEFAALCRGVRTAFSALGTGSPARAAAEEASLAFRRSIYAVADVAEGEAFTPANVRVIRPGFGLAPRHLDRVIGATAARPVARGTALDWTMVAGAGG